MKPHKHAELIKAWADGVEIEYFSKHEKQWFGFAKGDSPSWDENTYYRIKPEPKPDVVNYYMIENPYFRLAKKENGEVNLKLTFDGETGKLKSAEVL